MASFTMFKYGSLGVSFTRRFTLAPLSFHARHIQGGSEHGVTDKIKKGVDETLKAGDNLKNKASSTVGEVFDNGNESKSGVADRAKEVAQNAWESAKGSAEGSGMAVEVDGPRLHKKDDVEMAKRSMNTKKDDN